MKKWKKLKRAICGIIAIGVIISCPRNAYASDSSKMDEYLNVIEDFNKENGCNLEITDMEQFMNNVYNRVSPEEFYSLIKGDAVNQTIALSDDENATQINPRYKANQNIEYAAPITCGNWSSVVFATIETQYLYSGATNFVRYVCGGAYYSSYDTSYKFIFNSIQCTSLTAKACTVKYVGYWKVPATGLTDLTTRTYTITYYAE